jgi:hypothetical protein
MNMSPLLQGAWIAAALVALAGCGSRDTKEPSKTSKQMCVDPMDDCDHCLCEIQNDFIGTSEMNPVYCSNTTYQSSTAPMCMPYCADNSSCGEGRVCVSQAWGSNEDPAPGACTQTGTDDWECGVCALACGNNSDCPMGWVCEFSRKGYPNLSQNVPRCRGRSSSE